MKFLEKLTIKNTSVILLFVFLHIILSENMMKLCLNLKFSFSGFLLTFLFSISISLTATFFATLFKGRVRQWLIIGIMSLISFYYCVQAVYYVIMGTFLSLFSLIYGGEALSYGNVVLRGISNSWYIILFLLLILAAFIYVIRQIQFEGDFKTAGVIAVAAILTHFIAFFSINFFGKDFFSPYEFYNSNLSPSVTTEYFGSITYFRLDIRNLIFGVPNTLEVSSDDKEYAEPTTKSTEPIITNTQTPSDTPPPAQIEYKDNIMDLDFAALSKGKGETIQQMSDYFSGVTITQQNDHTGRFEGYNLITITAEAFAPYAIDKDRTPTLYKMVNEGYNFTNYYCPEWGVSTSDGEYVNCVGLIPKSGVWSMYRSGADKISLPFVMGNQFKKLGYQTNAYHNNTYTYYKRDVSHPNLGYTYKGMGNGLNLKKVWPRSDVEMIDITTPEYLNGQPFHTYYMTVSGHMIYTYAENNMSSKHKKLVENLDLSEPAQAYLACNVELDRAMELLLKRLAEAGVAEKTLIVLSPDHPPYGLTKPEVSELIGHTVEENFEYYKSTLIMYCQGMTPETIDKPCYSLDIVPTLSNLFGLEYDSRLLIGRDIFSTSPPLVLFENRSFITDKIKFNSKTGNAETLNNAEIEKDYVKNINRTVANKFKYSTMILDNDYYRKIGLQPN